MNNMEKIFIDEIKKQIESGKKLSELGIVVKKRLPMTEKIYLVEGYKSENKDETSFFGLVDDIICFDNDLAKINFSLKEVLTISTIVLNYSNVTIDFDSNLNFYDTLIEFGIYKYIANLIDPEDLMIFNYLVENNLSQYILTYNSPLSFLNRKFEELMKIIPNEKEMRNVVDQIKNIDEKKLNKLKGIVGKYVGVK
jgi:hypothetical protein